MPDNSNMGWSKRHTEKFYSFFPYIRGERGRHLSIFGVLLKETRMPINTRLLCSPALPQALKGMKTSPLCVKRKLGSPLCTCSPQRDFLSYFVQGSNPLEAKLVRLWTSYHKMKAFFSAVREAVDAESCRLVVLWRQPGEKWTPRKLARLCGGGEASSPSRTQVKHPVLFVSIR